MNNLSVQPNVCGPLMASLLRPVALALCAAGVMLFSVPSFSAPAQNPAQVTNGTAKKTKRATLTPIAAKKTVKKASAKKTAVKKVRNGRAVRTKAKNRAVSRGPSQAALAGLHKTVDWLSLGSSVAYAVDQDTGEELYEKNADVSLPIASITKLMTALVIAESDLPMNQKLRVTREDYVRSRASSKLRSGMVLTRKALLQMALMSSDNRAAHVLARTYPGGKKAFVAKMNEKAREIGMEDAFFADPTGLDNRNRATARDIGRLASAVHRYEDLSELSTAPVARVRAGKRTLTMKTTNRLIGDPDWEIGVQKTGFTTAAGRCMVVQTEAAGRRIVFVVLDSPNNNQRALDMKTMKSYVEAESRFSNGFGHVMPYAIF